MGGKLAPIDPTGANLVAVVKRRYISTSVIGDISTSDDRLTALFRDRQGSFDR